MQRSRSLFYRRWLSANYVYDGAVRLRLILKIELTMTKVWNGYRVAFEKESRLINCQLLFKNFYSNV